MADTPPSDFAIPLAAQATQAAVAVSTTSSLPDVYVSGAKIDASPRSKIDHAASTGLTVAGVDDSANDKVTVTYTNAMAAVATTAGDLLVATAAGLFKRLGLGTANQVLAVNAGATDVAWATSTAPTVYRTTGVKDVANTVTETDLFNGAITVAANAMSTNKRLRVFLGGDALYNNNAADFSRIKIKLGSTVLIDTGTGKTVSWINPSVTTATRYQWGIWFEICELYATNAQWVTGYAFQNLGAALTGGTGSSASFQPAYFSSIAAAAVDTTSAQALTVTCTWSAASTNNSLRCQYGIAVIE